MQNNFANIERILERVENGLLDRDTVLLAALKYMGDEAAGLMASANEFFYTYEEAADEDADDYDPMDDFNYVGSRHHY